MLLRPWAMGANFVLFLVIAFFANVPGSFVPSEFHYTSRQLFPYCFHGWPCLYLTRQRFQNPGYIEIGRTYPNDKDDPWSNWRPDQEVKHFRLGPLVANLAVAFALSSTVVLVVGSSRIARRQVSVRAALLCVTGFAVAFAYYHYEQLDQRQELLVLGYENAGALPKSAAIPSGWMTSGRGVPDWFADVFGIERFDALSHVDALYLADRDPPEIASLKDVSACRRVRMLKLDYLSIPSSDLANIADWNNLVTFVPNDKITDDGLAQMEIEKCSKLCCIALTGNGITDAGIERLGGLKWLSRLSLGGTRVTDRGLECFEDPAQFRFLMLGGAPITDAGMRFIGRCSGLIELKLNSTNITDEGLKHLGSLRELRELSIRQTKVRGSGLKHLAKLPNLHVLNVSSLPISSELVELLDQAPQILHIKANFTHVSDAEIPALSRIIAKRREQLQAWRKAAKGGEKWEPWFTLELNDTRITIQGAETLEKEFGWPIIWHFVSTTYEDGKPYLDGLSITLKAPDP
jgi:hypothetical protein